MYSFKMDNEKESDSHIEGKASADRYTSLALRYQAGPLEGILVGDMTDWSNLDKTKGRDDGYTVTLGGNYTFDGGLKVLAFYQYFDSMRLSVRARGGVATDGIVRMVDDYGFVDGWGTGIGVNYPIFGGTARAALNYRQMDNEKGVDFTRTTVGAAFDYPLSKRTWTYVMTGYSQVKVETAKEEATPNGYQLSLGLVHKF